MDEKISNFDIKNEEDNAFNYYSDYRFLNGSLDTEVCWIPDWIIDCIDSIYDEILNERENQDFGAKF